MSTLTIGRQKVPLSNLDKPLYPSGFTKAEVIDYYLRVAPTILPYLQDRAATLKRYPNGSDHPFFFEKNCPVHRPSWAKTAAIHGRTGTVNHCVIHNAASLAWVANLAALELHVPLAKTRSPGKPTVVVFDLDPGEGVTIFDCFRLAIRMRDTLFHINLQCCPKTSGGKGVHLYIPLSTAATFDQTKHFAQQLALAFERDNPAKVTANMSRSGRRGKIFIDWSQNDQHKTTVCAYSLRAKEQPTVSTPITWEEVEAALASPRKHRMLFTAADVLQRIEGLGDLFSPVLTLRQKLPT